MAQYYWKTRNNGYILKKKIFFSRGEYSQGMTRIFVYVWCSLILLPGCSGAQKSIVQEVESAPVSSQPVVIERIAPLQKKKVYEFVQIDGESYDVPRPWRGKKITEQPPDPSTLKQIPTDFTYNQSKLFLTEKARDALVVMAEAAREEGIELLAHSGYRSSWYQRKIFSQYMAEGRTWEDLVRYVAPPGYSEHMLGESVDFYPSNWRFASTEAYRWLSENAHHYHFYETYPEVSSQGYPWEAWHWKYIAPQESIAEKLSIHTSVTHPEPTKTPSRGDSSRAP